MPTFQEARRLILSRVEPVGVERVALLDALGRVIAEDVVAPWNMPLCDNSAMDGYAVRAADCAAETALPIIGYIPAGGSVTRPVESGTAIKIMTGAPLPGGADAVVPIEDAQESDGRVRIAKRVVPGAHVRFAGEDVRLGEVIVGSGTVIRAPEISMLAAIGKALVSVYRRPRVAVLATGDELVELGEPIEPGRIINSNSMGLAAAIAEVGAVPEILGIARDTRESHREKMIQGLRADVFITSAGVSAGDRDFVREVLAELGVKQAFAGVDIRPGGPTAFGVRDGKPVFSLPGNPVATLITFEEFVRPALLKMLGFKRVIRPAVSAALQEPHKKKPGKLKFLRVRLDFSNGVARAYSSGDQNTGMLKTMLMADGIALLEADRSSFSPGDEVEVHVLSNHVQMMDPDEVARERNSKEDR